MLGKKDDQILPKVAKKQPLQLLLKIDVFPNSPMQAFNILTTIVLKSQRGYKICPFWSHWSDILFSLVQVRKMLDVARMRRRALGRKNFGGNFVSLFFYYSLQLNSYDVFGRQAPAAVQSVIKGHAYLYSIHSLLFCFQFV